LFFWLWLLDFKFVALTLTLNLSQARFLPVSSLMVEKAMNNNSIGFRVPSMLFHSDSREKIDAVDRLFPSLLVEIHPSDYDSDASASPGFIPWTLILLIFCYCFSFS